MPRKRVEGARILGPYRESESRWRLIEVSNGSRRSHFATDERSAQRLLGRLRRKKDGTGQTLRALLCVWEEHRLRAAVSKPSSVVHMVSRVRQLLAPALELPPAALTPSRAAELYELHTTRPSKWGRPFAVASHHWDLKMTRAFCRWAIDAGFLPRDPFAAVTLVGRARTGKPQLRLDEARAFTDEALRAWQIERDALALAALLALFLGLRASEALLRQVRDIDDGGRLLWIPHGKTRGARRHLVIPERLRGPLLQLAQGRRGAALLFERSGAPFSRASLARAVARVCRRAGVPVVCTHSLRGLHSTLAVSAGATSEAVSAALGHSSLKMTLKHYIAPGAADAADAVRAQERLNRS